MGIVVLVTIPKDRAVDFARALLSEHVCACINIINDVKSFYWWKSKIEEVQEARETYNHAPDETSLSA